MLSILIIAVLSLNFCSIRRDPPPRTEPANQTEDSETTGERETFAGLEKKTPPAAEDSSAVNDDIFQTGEASWYGPNFHGKRTANGEVYDMNKLTAAHKKLEFHTLVEVENIDNGKRVLVRVNDRGPFIKGRIIDLSKKAARKLGIIETGTAPVHLRLLKPSEVGKPRASKTTTPTAPVTPPNPVFKKETDAVSSQEINEPPPASQQTEQSQQTERVNMTPDPPPRPPAVTGTVLYYVQVGAFSTRKNAQRRINHIQDVLPGLNFGIKEIGGLFKVFSRGMYTREEADQLKKRLKDNDFTAFVVTLNQ